MTPAPPRRAAGLVLALALGSGCAAPGFPATAVPLPAPAEVAWTLLLIGDAGSPQLPDDPTYAALERAAAAARGRATIVFLGDNVYPAGLRDSLHPARAADEAILRAQVDVVRRAGAGAIFLAGNHDWSGFGDDGWDAVRRQEAFVEQEGQGMAEFLPGAGCPGPAVREPGPAFRLVVLDTEWWVHGGLVPGPKHCTPGTAAAVEDSLRAALQTGGRHAVVLAHHPLASGGRHGGHFSWRHHLFPLVDLYRWAWLPLPVIGSLYPLARQQGVSDQDISGLGNERMRAAMHRAMAARPPLAWAAGHEHALQVIGTRPLVLVSGTGSTGHGSWVGRTDSTRYASVASGWIRLDALVDGQVRVAVVEVAGDGAAREAWAAWAAE